MRNHLSKLSLKFGIVAMFVAIALVFGVSAVSAQSSGSSCNPPNFQITSSKNISAIAGESFTYFVVTANNTSYSLDSELPVGLNFSNNQISGVPQTPGDYSLVFVASNSCGTTTQRVNLSVIGGSPSASTSTTDPGSNQVAQAQGSVGLNEIPDTGFSADQALTLSFYALALLLISYAGVRKLSPQFVSGDVNGSVPSTRSGETNQSPKKQTNSKSPQVGDGIVS